MYMGCGLAFPCSQPVCVCVCVCARVRMCACVYVCMCVRMFKAVSHLEEKN